MPFLAIFGDTEEVGVYKVAEGKYCEVSLATRTTLLYYKQWAMYVPTLGDCKNRINLY